MRITGCAALAAVAVLLAAPASADVEVNISSDASYDLSLKCYRYYDVAQQIAGARAGAAEEGSGAQKDQQRNALASQILKMAWNQQIDATKGGKTSEQVDEDLAEASSSIVADANAGLGGDPDASARYDAIREECRPSEIVTE